MSGSVDLLLLSLWLLYFLQHSLFASFWFKQALFKRFPSIQPVYRLIYNLLSTFLLIPVILVMYREFGPLLIQWSGAWQWLSYSLTVLALLGFAITMKYYDGADFMGFKQLKAHPKDHYGGSKFCLSPLHRYVRHPWYFLGLVLVWTRDMDVNLLMSALLISLYLLIGSRLEERKLVKELGAVYLEYMTRVPGLLPLPWKYLTAAEAENLQQSGN